LAKLQLLIGVTIGVIGYIYTQQSIKFSLGKLTTDFYANVSTELISIVITVLAIETLKDRVNWRNYQREKQSQENNSFPPSNQLSEQGDQEKSAEFETISSPSLNGFGILCGVLIGFLLGIVIQQNWRESTPKKNKQ
jgi:hypothetical protein